MKKIPEGILYATSEAHKLAERQGFPVFVCEFQDSDGRNWIGCRFNEHSHVDGYWFHVNYTTNCRVLKVVQHPENCQSIPHIA